MLQAKKGCCLVGSLCDSQTLGFEDLWNVQCGEVYEQCIVPGKTQLFWMKILILNIAMPQRYLAVGATTNENKWALTATPQIASYTYYPAPPHSTPACSFSLLPWIVVNSEDKRLPQGWVEPQVSPW